MSHTLTNEEECRDFVRGACFFGVGGGGDPVLGMRMLKEDLEAGIRLTWIDMDELEDDAMTCCAWGMGSIAPRAQQVMASSSISRPLIMPPNHSRVCTSDMQTSGRCWKTC